MNRFPFLLITSWISWNYFFHPASGLIDVQPNTNTVIEGGNVAINCTPSANSTNTTGFNFTWSKSGAGRVLSNSSQLTLYNVDRSDAGNYTCTATNGTSNWSAVAVATLTVFYSPQIISSTGNLIVNESSKTSLFCNASGNPSPTIQWSLPNGSIVVIRNNEFLEFDNTSKNQHGRYVCQANNNIGSSTAVAMYLDVQYAPQIISSTGNLTVNESSKTSLFCNSGGNPSPTIQWSLPNGSIIVIRNNEFLEFDKTSKSQHGRYVCQANNIIGSSPSVAMYVNVQYKPKINITGRETIIDSWLHHNSTLNCQADGNPHSEITWSKDDKELLTGSISANIRIIPKTDTDFGTYICTAWNALGKAFFRVEVNRTAFPPGAPIIIDNGTQLSSRSLILNWTTPNNNGRPILRYWVLHRKQNSNWSEVTWKKNDVGNIDHYNFTLEWTTSYEFAVTAENDQGESKKSNKEVYTAPPEPTTRMSVPTHTTPSKTSDTVLYAAVAGGCGLFLVIVVIVSLCFVKRRRRRHKHRQVLPTQPYVDLKEISSKHSLSAKNPSRLQSINTYNAVPNRNETRPRESEHVSPKSPTLEIYTNVCNLDDEISNWEFPRGQVHIEKYVGKGAFCVVAKAYADGIGTVAVKIPKEKAPDSNKKDLLAEYELMKQLRPHPNVIRLMGAVTCSDPVMVMFEYIPYGDLLGFLRRSRGLHDKYYKDPDVKPSSSLKSEQLLKFAREVADGMAFLAANKIIHRDLAARNVLVGEEETCKITDFGMARDVQQNAIYQKRTKGRLPVKWTAMESLLYGRCTSQSDVWSYGVVLYEIFTIGGKPYPNIEPHRIPFMLKDNYRMPKPDHLDNEIYALMCECWKTEPDRRPTFDSISRTIGRLERCHKEVIYMNVYDDNLYGNVEDWD